VTAATDARSAAAAVGAGGLVPSKTSLSTPGDSLVISFGASVLAERRVARLKRAVWGSGHLHGLAENGQRPAVPWFVTLTYADADAWEPDQVSAAVQRFRLWCKRLGVPCRYTWVAEIQPQRLTRTGEAAVHYHLIAWLPVGVSMPKWDRQRTASGALWWPWGMSNRDKARAGVGYLMKYLSKLGELTRFPKGLRLYGIGGLSLVGRSVRTWLNLPEWAKRVFGVGEVVRKSCGLVVSSSGEVLASPYRLRLVPGGARVSLVGTVAPRFHDGAWSRLPVPCL